MAEVVLSPPHALPNAHSETSCLNKERWKTDERLRTQLWKGLCKKGDPPPREVAPGAGDPGRVCSNVNALLAKSPGALPVRGWKVLLLHIQGVEATLWQALAHVVVLRNGALVDPTSDRFGPYVFLPSTRLMPRMPDEELLSGAWCLPSIVGGNDGFVTHMLLQHSKTLAASPETAVPRRLQMVKVPRGVADWASRTHPDRDLVCLLEAMKIAKGCDFDSPVRDNTLDSSFFESVRLIERTSLTAEHAQSRLDTLLNDIYGRHC